MAFDAAVVTNTPYHSLLWLQAKLGNVAFLAAIETSPNLLSFVKLHWPATSSKSGAGTVLLIGNSSQCLSHLWLLLLQ